MTLDTRSNIPLCLQEFPQAAPLGTPSGKGVYLTVYPLSCPYTDTVYTDLSHNTDISISKSYTSSIVLPGGEILAELILGIGLAPKCPLDEAIRVRIDPVENSVVGTLGNTHGQESNTKRVKFQYYPFW